MTHQCYKTLYPDINAYQYYRALPTITTHYQTLPTMAKHYQIPPNSTKYITEHYQTDYQTEPSTIPNNTKHYRTITNDTEHYQTHRTYTQANTTKFANHYYTLSLPASLGQCPLPYFDFNGRYLIL